jgi:hypothetical protein
LLAPLFFHGRLTDVALLGKLRPEFERTGALNLAMQRLLCDWGARNRGPLQPDGRLLDQSLIDWFHEMNRALNDRLDDNAVLARLRGNARRMDWLATEILGRAREAHPGIDGFGLDTLLEGREVAEVSLDAKWYGEVA